MSNHYELRYEQDYIAKLSENGATCTEIVFFCGEQIHRAEFPTSNLGCADRGGYLQSLVITTAREHKVAVAARIVPPQPLPAKPTRVEQAAKQLGNL